jgi:plastocyanin
MSSETLFYLCGGVLAVSAVVATFAGLKLSNFPGRALPLVAVWFAAFAVATGTFAVLHAEHEQEAKAAEFEEANEAIEEAEGDIGSDTEAVEQEGEAGAEGSEEEEPAGESAGSEEGKGSSEGAAASTTLKLSADATALAFDTTELSAKPGTVTIDFDNPSAIPHNVVIEEGGKELAGFEPIAEGKEEVSADLEAGTYTFLCTVPGHAPAGMEGTLTVE